MSTITAVKKNGQIAIACDTMIKWGSEQNTAKHVVNHNKIFEVGENFIAVTGAAAGAHALRHFMAEQENEVILRSVQDVFLYWRDFQKALKEEYLFEAKVEDSGFEPNTMDILLVNPYGIFAVGAYRDVQHFNTYYAYGAGNEYALGAIYTQYDHPDFNAQQLAELGIAAAAEFNDSTGLPIISNTVQAID